MLTKGFINKDGDTLYFHPEYSPDVIEIEDGDAIEYEHGPDNWVSGTLEWNGSYWECYDEDRLSKFGPVSSLNARIDI